MRDLRWKKGQTINHYACKIDCVNMLKINKTIIGFDLKKYNV